MPWTADQQKTARAIAHGWKPRGKVKGFTRAFAEQVLSESKTKGTRKPRRPRVE